MDDSPIWTVAQAKARLSELIEKPRTRGPQTITRIAPSVTTGASRHEASLVDVLMCS